MEAMFEPARKQMHAFSRRTEARRAVDFSLSFY